MKLIHTLLIVCILYLWSMPVYGSSMDQQVDWQPELTFIWTATFTVFAPVAIQTDHFRWAYDPDRPYSKQVGRIVAMEKFIHEVESRSMATPEPGTFLLLASGLVGIIAVRRSR